MVTIKNTTRGALKGEDGVGEGSQSLPRKVVEERRSGQGEGEDAGMSRAEGGASGQEGRWTGSTW